MGRHVKRSWYLLSYLHSDNGFMQTKPKLTLPEGMQMFSKVGEDGECLSNRFLAFERLSPAVKEPADRDSVQTASTSRAAYVGCEHGDIRLRVKCILNRSENRQRQQKRASPHKALSHKSIFSVFVLY